MIVCFLFLFFTFSFSSNKYYLFQGQWWCGVTVTDLIMCLSCGNYVGKLALTKPTFLMSSWQVARTLCWQESLTKPLNSPHVTLEVFPKEKRLATKEIISTWVIFDWNYLFAPSVDSLLRVCCSIKWTLLGEIPAHRFLGAIDNRSTNITCSN